MYYQEFSLATQICELNDLPAIYRNVLWIGRSNEAPCSKAMTSICVDFEKHEVSISSAIGNPVPLFYGWTKSGTLVVSDSAENVRRLVERTSAPCPESLDWVGVVEGLLFDGPLASRSLFKDVCKTQIGEKLRIDLKNKTIEKEWHWLPSIQTIELDQEPALKEAKRQLLRLGQGLDEYGEAILPITGGFDSRILAGIGVYERKMDLTSYTFQRGWSLESICARKVASMLGSTHSIIDLPPKDCYQKFAREVVKRSGGMVSGMHCHGIYSCEKKISAGDKIMDRIFGYFGDPVTGAMTDEKQSGSELSTPEKVFEQYRTSLFGGLIDCLKPEILVDLGLCYEAFVESGSRSGTFHEFWKIQQRQNNLITHLFSYHRTHHNVKVVLPFVDQEFIDFFIGLPYEMRRDRALFKQAAADLYPKLFALPSMHFGKGSLLSKFENIFEVMESIANRVSPNQEIILSPFKYEQHEKNLANFLSEDIQNGARIISKYFEEDEVKVSFPVWRYSSNKEYYRLASLSYLLDDCGSRLDF
jgi:asparagine synthase (glutamine-hydrolysing)